MSVEQKNFYQKYCFPLLEKLDPETAHHLIISLLQTIDHQPLALKLLRQFATQAGYRETPRLHSQLAGLDLSNPFILAAGMDKNVQNLNLWRALGFASVVAGSVLRFPQPGNPKPRIFRSTIDEALLNSMGFPSQGLPVTKQKLARYSNRDFPLGLSLGINKDRIADNYLEDLNTLATNLVGYVDYLELNLSSPNTQGLRAFQAPIYAREIIHALRHNLTKPLPIFLKLSPDLSLLDLELLVNLGFIEKLAGFVATNTSIDSEIKQQLPSHLQSLSGGVSGQLLRQKSNQVIRNIFELSAGQIPIIGCGGVDDLQSVLEKFSAGASAISLYTGLVYQGPGLIAQLTRQLDDWMIKHGVNNISQIRGQAI